MLKIDEQLLELAKGKTGDSLEMAIAQLPNAIGNEQVLIWGNMLDTTTLLLEEERAQAYIEKLINKHWCETNLFLMTDIEHTHIDPQSISQRLQQFLQSGQGKSRLFQYIKRNNRLHYKQFLSLVFEKELNIDPIHTGLAEVICFSVKDKYLVQGIYTEQESFWRTIYAKKMYSIVRQTKLEKIEQPIAFMRFLKEMLQADCTANRIATILHKLVVELDYHNPKTFELKQLHLLNIVNHYLSGRRSLQRLEKCIDYFLTHWSNGNFKITEKEQTLIVYLKFMRAIELHKKNEQLALAYALIEDEKLNTHAVEIFFEFGEILKLAQPKPASIIKYYPDYYLEHVYSLILHTFVENEHYEEALQLLQQVELASCIAIYNVLNGDVTESSLAQIEATVQRDITNILNRHPSEMMEAIAIWKQTYLNDPKYLMKLAKSTAKHVQVILKTLFITEQFDCFEKLMDVYKKYLEIPSYTNSLKQFIQTELDEREKTVTI